MLTRDDVLIGWLCMMRMQHGADDEDEPVAMRVPDLITDELSRRGWIEVPSEDADWQGDHGYSITDAGISVTDINAADWGIELDFESESQT